ncbi:MAG: efflux RND transporter periplasmic adaptor subunit [Kangiellaceae bacterium]|nr:efflux RND transporter periplasmic adaptor subunit [Kangiellaceae bacterium]MCW9016406.1 efflux RND transporter periplasmic adaptor subunit [Kangiellaceae bacterium]
MKDKSELLNQLKIDRDAQPQNSGLSIGVVIVIALACGLLGFWLAQFFGSSQESKTINNPGPDVVAEFKILERSNEQSHSEQTATPDTLTKQVTTQPSPSESILNASGYITPRRMATVSAEVMGLITQVNVEEGMQVKQGDVLAKLDDAVARVNLELSQAQLETLIARRDSAKAALTESEQNYQRIHNNDFSSDADRTRSVSQLAQSKAALASSVAEIKVASLDIQRQQERLADYVIRAPFAGVVTVKNAQPGEIVSPSSAGGGFTRTGICTIVDMDSLEIEVDVNESYIGRVFEGQNVEAQLDAYPDWDIPAQVIAIIPTADRAKATVRVRIKINIKDTKILPEMGVKVAFLGS